ncbi:MAG: hypothetical protein DMF94_22075 [Acidobacteria bacterium]|nr:MAG: hypothetical protein DMF94_22075 [Acidobacteriota bacterium]
MKSRRESPPSSPSLRQSVPHRRVCVLGWARDGDHGPAEGGHYRCEARDLRHPRSWRWAAIAALDEELHALRPSSGARRSSRAMGLRLLTTWQTLHPDARIEQALTLARLGRLGPALPIAFAGACTCAGIERRPAVEAFAYTRLASTISAAMRLMPIGQTDAHALLARTLDRVPAVVDRIVARDDRVESFSPALDIAAMTQQYLHSRLFRS